MSRPLALVRSALTRYLLPRRSAAAVAAALLLGTADAHGAFLTPAAAFEITPPDGQFIIPVADPFVPVTVTGFVDLSYIFVNECSVNVIIQETLLLNFNDSTFVDVVTFQFVPAGETATLNLQGFLLTDQELTGGIYRVTLSLTLAVIIGCQQETYTDSRRSEFQVLAGVPVPIPGPSALVLAGLGATGLLCRARLRRRWPSPTAGSRGGAGNVVRR